MFRILLYILLIIAGLYLIDYCMTYLTNLYNSSNEDYLNIDHFQAPF